MLPLVWSLQIALLVGELASALPEDGGYYVWVRRALGPFWGFQEAWLSLAASVVIGGLVWGPKMLAGVKKGMLPREVGAKFPGAEKVDEFGFSDVQSPAEGVAKIRFYFTEAKPGGPGPKKLRSADIYFHPALNS